MRSDRPRSTNASSRSSPACVSLSSSSLMVLLALLSRLLLSLTSGPPASSAADMSDVVETLEAFESIDSDRGREVDALPLPPEFEEDERRRILPQAFLSPGLMSFTVLTLLKQSHRA